MDKKSLNCILSRDPFVQYIEIAPTLAQIWFDHNAIELTEDDWRSLSQQIGWYTGGRIILRDNEIFSGVLELLIAPGYAQTSPQAFQRVLESITLLMRAAAPGCIDFTLDRSNLEPELIAATGHAAE